MLWRDRRSRVIAAAALTGGALLWAVQDAWPWRRPLTAPAILVTRAYDDWSDTLRRNETLSDVLRQARVAGPDHVALLTAATELDARRLLPGTVFHFRKARGDSVVQRVMVRPVPDRRIWLVRGDSGWAETVEQIPWTTTRLRVMGRISSSLYEAIDSAVVDTVLPQGERVALAWAFANVYDWEVDFTRDLRPGDRFDVLFDRLESPDGQRRFGRIWAARVEVRRGPSYAFYFEAEPGRGAFYDEEGRSLRRAFLRTPLEFRRISSRFGGRYHPILKRWRSHQGTDYAAGYGTPVRATADGYVVKAGRESGYGNLIELRHVSGIRTRYGHLSRFANGMRVGARVSQSQTIGYVGSTGLSTGPHLHYEFLVNGRPTNPQRKDAGPVQRIPDDLRAAFDAVRAHLLTQLHTRTPAPAAVAGRDD